MLYDALTAHEQTLVEKMGTLTRIPRGGEMLREGSPGTSLYILKSGAAQVRKQIDPDKYKQLKDLRAGDFFGEMSLLTASVRSAHVVATEDCEVLEITREALDAFAAARPAIALKLYRNMAMELARRLKKNNDELKNAILWALDEMAT